MTSDSLSQFLTMIKEGRRAHDLDLRDADLHGADISNLSADDLDMRKVDLRGATLHEIRLSGCRLDAAKLENADWSRAQVRMCVLDSAQAIDTCFDGACLEDCSAKGIDLTRASLRGARLSETSFERAVLCNAVFDEASGDGIVFRGADLQRASFVGVQFEDADFRGADLRGANIQGGTFLHADFRGALLEGVSFADTDCTGAYFDEDEQARPAASSTKTPEAPFHNFETLLQEFIRHIDKEITPTSSLLDQLLRQAGVGTQHAGSPEQVEMLRQFAASLHQFEALADHPEALMTRYRELLEGVLPQLQASLSEADWQTLSNLLSQLNTANAAASPQSD